MVIHTGHRGVAWPHPTSLAGLILRGADMHSAPSDHVPHFRFLLDDLVAPGAPSIWTRDLTDLAAITLFLLTTAHKNPHVLAELRESAMDRVRTVFEAPTGEDDVLSMLRYVSVVAPDPDKIELRELIRQLGPKAKEIEMTLAEEWRAEGEAKILLKQMRLKFGKVSDSILETVQKATSEQLEAWRPRS